MAQAGPILELASRHAGVGRAIARGLGETERAVARALASDREPVAELCRHVERYRGKMLRPSLVFACAMGAGRGDERAVRPEHAVFGAVVEIIHIATLVHDDVLDDARMRRRVATVNALRGNEAAVILGDYLISSAFHLCSSLADQSIALRVGAVTTRVCEGELLQLHHRHNQALSEAAYFDIIERKTASLIEVCCEVGAGLAGADDATRRALGAFGSRLGLAFQIRDDLLDLIGDEAVVGKTLGSDLAKGKMTLPLIHHLASAGPVDRARTADLLERLAAAGESAPVSAEDRRRIVDGLRATGSIEAATARAAGLVAEARGYLGELPESPARELLVDLAEAAVGRDR